MKTVSNLEAENGAQFSLVSHEEIEIRAVAGRGSPPAFDLDQALSRARGIFGRAAKRSMDVVGGSVALVLLALPLLLAALAIKLTSPGPVLFRQMRTGLRGETFMIYKFRTMYVQENGPSIRHASRDDPRVTRVGTFLRRRSIDELPQLINVLRGEMSLVGPRPHALAHDVLYSRLIPHYHRRFATKPGMTGLAQLRGFRGEIHNIACMGGRIDADCEYIATWSIWRDIAIVLSTVPRMWHDKRAY